MEIGDVANQAAIETTDEEKNTLEKELEDVIEAFESLDELDLSDEEPAFHPVKTDDELRSDQSHEGLTQKEAVENSRNRENGYFVGPAV